jgi:RHS repeat-associated protein
MRPRNETGQTGVDLGSRNFNWETPIVSLPGRGNLNLDLTLYLNSLVWTQDGSYIKYNADLGSPGPGFQLGLPKLQQRFTDALTGTYGYVMVTPSGARVEMREVGSSSIYESQDANYTQLDTSTMIVRTTDGTQFAFVPVNINGEYRCNQIKDRNGNYISATYDVNNGHLLTVTDTLSRVITFAYDTNGNLSAIQQTWGGVTHNWATFFYGQVLVAPAFGGGLLINGPNNSNVTVLTQVSLHDGSSYTFEYNTAFGQVRRINHYESDGRLRNYTWYNMNTSSGQTDCPRFTEQHDWAEMWNNGNEAITYFSVAADGSSSQKTMPDGTIYKEYFATTGWQSGLTTLMEVWSGNVRKKWVTTAWTQDDETLSYQKNARVTDTSVYDEAGNRRRISISYGSYAAYSLPYEILEYAADGTTAWRSKYIDYNLSADYVNRRIIGLPGAIHIVDHTITAYLSKTTFEYDWDNSTNTYLVDQGAATQHDSSYSASFRIGRGNLTAVRRWNVNAINDANQAMWTSFTGYNTNGSIIFSADGLGHETRFTYSDAFSDGNNHNTFAYPTTVTDAELNASTTQYNYDFGAPTRSQDPAPAGQPQGLIKTFSYDGAARLERVTTANTGAYTRYVYGPYYFQTFSTVNTVADEAYSCQILDGAGRATSQSANHPGSTGGYIGQLTTYDVMGRAVQQTNPTEITGGWSPVGDDAAWVWTYRTYDWNGRPTTTTLPDGNTREITYGGCGCAGGAVVTSRDERGRRRRATMDVVGRLKQVDELNWDQSVYSTTTYSYNVRDQLTQINQAGQLRTFEYDGWGRLWRRTTPEQGANTYSYFNDDTAQTITDARGATTTFGYNNRHQMTSISYGVPAGVAVTPNVSFSYDAAGNRTSMADGLGSVSYAYDQLSRLTSETRTFSGVGSFALNYSYNLAGELTSITNPWNVQVGYSYDTTGRPTSVSGVNYGGVSSYVNSISYRAFATKQISYGNNRTLSMGYDNRLRPTQYSIPGVIQLQYEYGWENTGRAEFVRNLDDQTLDRWFAYDQVGRLVVSRSGTEARIAFGEQIPVAYDGPYSQGYAYDVWGNRTHIEGWGGVGRWEDHTYTNNRRDGMQYDAAGNGVDGNWFTFSFDAASRQTRAASPDYTLDSAYDGDGLRAKKNDNGDTIYYLRSSMLGGQVLAEIYGGGVSYSGSGWWLRGYVYLGGEMVAVQAGGVNWVHQDPVAKSQRITDSSGTVINTIELDPFGADTSRSSSNQAFQPHRFTSYEREGNGADDAMFRRYNRWWAAFDEPDPDDGSYNLTDPQSFNRYAYVSGDPVNFVDPTGLVESWNFCSAQYSFSDCGGWGGISGGYFGDDYAEYQREYGGLSPEAAESLHLYNQRVNNAMGGYGFITNDELRRIEANAWVRDPETGELVPAGSAVWAEDNDIFSTFFGKLDSWPPPGPGRGPFGWPEPGGKPVVRLPPGISTTPTEGKPEVRVPTDTVPQPRINPSNPTLPANPTFWDRVRLILGGAGQIFHNWPRFDVVPPTVMPNTMIRQMVCTSNPNNPGCSPRIPG